jgi:hypothetical protein
VIVCSITNPKNKRGFKQQERCQSLVVSGSWMIFVAIQVGHGTVVWKWLDKPMNLEMS